MSLVLACVLLLVENTFTSMVTGSALPYYFPMIQDLEIEER